MTLSLPPQFSQSNRRLYYQYRCDAHSPLTCENSQGSNDTNTCSKCLFPTILPAKAKLRGHRGIYVIEEFLFVRGIGRLYRGFKELDDAPVIIREYLLPKRCFNAAETYQRQQVFTGLAGINLADGRAQDFRLITPYDAIADQSESRCYLITLNNYNAYPSLQSQLTNLGRMPATQVRHVLAQLTQSLELLYRQKFRLPNGQVQTSLVHGNLSLETLLSQPQTEWRDDFVIYLSDLSLWEDLFLPTQTRLLETMTASESHASDLAAIGQIGIQLLLGEAQATVSDLPCSLEFETFLCRLLGVGQPFETIEAVRRSLQQLPPEPISSSAIAPISLEHSDRTSKINWKRWAIFALALLGIGGLIAVLSFILSSKPRVNSEKLLPTIDSVSNLPNGKFSYTAEEQSLWTYVLRQKNLIQQGKTLETILQERQPKLVLVYQPESSMQAALDRVKSQQAEFLITSLIEPISTEFEAQDIAYDGLTVFVAFSYAQRDKSLPRLLKGQLSFHQLKQLYTGEIDNWRQLGGADLPVRLYVPTEPELVRIFEQRVLRDEQSIRKFRALKDSAIASGSTFDNLRRVLRDFEQEQVGAIAFAPLSQVFGQCLVYPLALVENNQAPVHPLVLDTGKPVFPQIDLCNAKGSYDRNLAAFQTKRYPLMYSLAVVSARNNSRPPVGRKFSEILKTVEGQKLLNKTGLVPLQ